MVPISASFESNVLQSSDFAIGAHSASTSSITIEQGFARMK